MKTNMIKYIYPLIAFILLMGSCARTHYISIDVRKAAPLTFGPETKKIVIADNSFESRSSDLTELVNGRDSLKTAILDTLKTVFISSLAQYMNEEGVFDTVEVYPYYPKPLYVYKEAAGQQTELTLTKDEVFEIYEKTGATALISLDYIDLSKKFIAGYIPETAIVRGDLRAVVRVYAYEDSIIGVPVKKLEYPIRLEVDLSKQKDVLPSIKAEFVEGSQWLADMLVNVFIPRWEQQNRVYYADSSKPSYDSIAHMTRYDWAKTIPKWEEAYNNEKSWKKKVKYASNAALAYEYTDDIKTAFRWINAAYNLIPPNNESYLAKEIKNYRSKLMQRANEASLLSKQLKIGEEL